MINIVNTSTDPTFNLAMEEYFLKNAGLDDDVMILWQNSPVVVVGKHQNTLQEINKPFLDEHGIGVVRRLSGGGAVYHDLGNLNFTYIIRDCPVSKYDFAYFATPVIAALRDIGVTAEFTGRNDITINGQKFSGNAQYFWRNRLLHHGAMLFETDLNILSKVLNVRKQKYLSKGVQSVKSRVTNVREHISPEVTLQQFRDLIIQHTFTELGQPYREYGLTPGDISQINQLADQRYRTWDWNYGLSPHYNFMQEHTTEHGGTVSVYLDVQDGLIRSCQICGDFFAEQELADLEKLLVGHRHNRQELTELLSTVNISSYLKAVTNEEFLHCLVE